MRVSLTMERSYHNDVTIMVDVLRASTSITVALETFQKVIPTKTIEEAHNLAQKHEAILAGEREGKTLDNFDVGNSPVEIGKLKGETLVITTSNGTRILKNMGGHILIGSFINAREVAREALNLANNHIEVVMAGVNGRFAIEDFLGGGEIISHLQNEKVDEMAQTAVLALENREKVEYAIKNSRSARNLQQLGFDPDIDFCMQRDLSSIVPVYKNGIITGSE
ncbi:MAG TPA: 2-phosphosulfolactate phosphatase [Methanobacteriaceae archaeon]|nr:2-phosphosulfolactate phosphatase [Methanobacteriaceae archaeon]